MTPPGLGTTGMILIFILCFKWKNLLYNKIGNKLHYFFRKKLLSTSITFNHRIYLIQRYVMYTYFTYKNHTRDIIRTHIQIHMSNPILSSIIFLSSHKITSVIYFNHNTNCVVFGLRNIKFKETQENNK